MIFTETPLKGAFTIEIKPIEDERGFFSTNWRIEECVKRGINPKIAQCNITLNKRKGTIRGMHFQIAPHQEAKMVRCTRGSMFDVILDLRKNSATYGQWASVELTDQNRKTLYIPEGMAHGYQSLEDNVEVFYQISEVYHPESVRGVRWDDPYFAIRWPLPPAAVSPRDQSHPFFSQEKVLL